MSAGGGIAFFPSSLPPLTRPVGLFERDTDVTRALHERYMSDTLKIGGFMARGAENQLRLVVVPGVPTLGDGSVGLGDGRGRFSPEGFNVGGHL